MSSDEKDFLKFKKDGGDVHKFVKALGFQQRAENIDIKTEAGKKNAVYSYYKNFVGWTDEKVAKYITQIVKDLELDSEAEMSKNKIEEITKGEFEKVKADTALRAKDRSEAEVKFTDEVKDVLKEEKVETKRSNIIIRDMTQRDERGFTTIDSKFIEMRNDPKKISELWSFLMDNENFKKKVSQKKVNEEELKSFKGIKFTKKAEGSRKKDSVKEEETEDILI